MPTEEERRTDGPTGERKKGLVDKAVDMARERGLGRVFKLATKGQWLR